MSENTKAQNRKNSRSRSRSAEKEKENKHNNKDTSNSQKQSSPLKNSNLTKSRSSSGEQSQSQFKKSQKQIHTLYTVKKNCINYIKGICKKVPEECEDFHPKIQDNPISAEEFDASIESMKKYSIDDAELYNFCMEFAPVKQASKSDQLILIRHALSYYNYASFSFFHQTGIAYNDPKSVVYQIRREYIDSPLHPLGELMCKNNSKYLENYSFHTVFVSPLRRALQTAQIMFENHPQKASIKFLVLPQLTEILSKVCDVSDLATVREEFKDSQFDFSLFEQFNFTNENWQVENIEDEDLKTYLRAMINQDTDGRAIKEILLDECEKAFPSQLEKHQHLYERALKAKAFIKNYIIKNEIDTYSQKICVVAHHAYLSSFTSEGKAQNGFVKNGRSFENCEAYPFSI